MKEKYRSLSGKEIQVLQAQGCRAANWNEVWVKDNFSPLSIENVRFGGSIYLGVFGAVFELAGGVRKPSGIRCAELHNVTVEDDCLIENVHGYLANYKIEKGAYLSDIGTMIVEGPTSFGIGTPVNVLSEAGDSFQVKLHTSLSAQEFALCCVLEPEKRKGINRIAEIEAAGRESMFGRVGHGAVITHVHMLKNVYIGEGACLDGTECMEECFVENSSEAPIRVGAGVICRHSVLQSGSEILDGAKVSECLVGQAVHIGKGFSAESSLFFANSYMDNGEACAVCAGPFTVSHHKSTLLIGCMCSFMNAGSGTNMSNHMYKLGPLHYGVLQRGCKTASGTHLVWGGQVGAFSMVMGKFDTHANTSCFPFSYLFNTDGILHVVPAVNFITVGTYRDVRKWASRDKRNFAVYPIDKISTYEPLNPYTMEQVRKGRERLQLLLHEQGEEQDEYFEENLVRITSKALHRGIDLYLRMEQLYLAQNISSIDRFPEILSGGNEEWIDLLGLLVPYAELHVLCKLVEEDRVDELAECFSVLGQRYPDLLQAHLYHCYTRAEAVEALRCYEENLVFYYDAVEADLNKEALLGGHSVALSVSQFMKTLRNDRQEQLKKAKEKTTSLLGNC